MLYINEESKNVCFQLGFKSSFVKSFISIHNSKDTWLVLESQVFLFILLQRRREEAETLINLNVASAINT